MLFTMRLADCLFFLLHNQLKQKILQYIHIIQLQKQTWLVINKAIHTQKFIIKLNIALVNKMQSRCIKDVIKCVFETSECFQVYCSTDWKEYICNEIKY